MNIRIVKLSVIALGLSVGLAACAAPPTDSERRDILEINQHAYELGVDPIEYARSLEAEAERKGAHFFQLHQDYTVKMKRPDTPFENEMGVIIGDIHDQLLRFKSAYPKPEKVFENGAEIRQRVLSNRIGYHLKKIKDGENVGRHRKIITDMRNGQFTPFLDTLFFVVLDENRYMAPPEPPSLSTTNALIDQRARELGIDL